MKKPNDTPLSPQQVPLPGGRQEGGRRAPRASASTPSLLSASANYVVLARKYRPATFDDLIGQEILVRTLRNAFAMNRIAQAFMLTGVRGVGKTTTARILARALNYEVPGKVDRPTLDMPELGVHCEAIMESRHIDVMEMDGASNTGIDDVREIIEAARYKPASARTRVFIIDEVHMLSKSAFNGLLKTLEEPPPHVKFIFATTEIGKVPVTILSRCQRFDLRRVEPEVLSAHFASIVAKEGLTADPDALELIARSAEGSVRDGLSLLDQALTLGNGHVTAALVLDMLGLAGRGAALELLERVFEGDAAGALSRFERLYRDGADPVMVLNGLADAVHLLSRQKVAPGHFPADFAEADRKMAKALAEKTSIARLSMAWQMLLKGIEETSRAARPNQAAEMLLIRMCYTAHLPSPADVIGELSAGTGAGGPAPGRGAQSTRSPAHEAPAPHVSQGAPPKPQRFASLEDIAAYAGQVRDIKLKIVLEEQVELIKFGPNFLELHVLSGTPDTFAQELSRRLRDWTGERWVVSLSDKRGAPPIAVARREAEQRQREELSRHPTVKRILHHFPDAQIKSVRPLDKPKSADG